MKDLSERKLVYLDDAIDAIVGCTNCGTEDELRAYVTRHSLEDVWSGGIVDALDAIEQLPSAQPERKTGEWIGADSQCGIGCPFCGTPVDDFCTSIDYIDLRYEPNFCPNCGADMKGGQDETD